MSSAARVTTKPPKIIYNDPDHHDKCLHLINWFILSKSYTSVFLLTTQLLFYIKSAVIKIIMHGPYFSARKNV